MFSAISARVSSKLHDVLFSKFSCVCSLNVTGEAVVGGFFLYISFLGVLKQQSLSNINYVSKVGGRWRGIIVLNMSVSTCSSVLANNPTVPSCSSV